jgi:hypothetical protein
MQGCITPSYIPSPSSHHHLDTTNPGQITTVERAITAMAVGVTRFCSMLPSDDTEELSTTSHISRMPQIDHHQIRDQFSEYALPEKCLSRVFRMSPGVATEGP